TIPRPYQHHHQFSRLDPAKNRRRRIPHRRRPKPRARLHLPGSRRPNHHRIPKRHLLHSLNSRHRQSFRDRRPRNRRHHPQSQSSLPRPQHPDRKPRPPILQPQFAHHCLGISLDRHLSRQQNRPLVRHQKRQPPRRFRPPGWHLRFQPP